MNRILRQYPPYCGNKPYIYFAFCKSDSKKVRPLLSLLYQRGCRIWYPSGAVSGLRQQELMTERRLGAELVIMYLSNSAMHDEDGVKSSVGFCQSRGIKLIILDEIGADVLSTGFTEDAEFISLSSVSSADELDSTLIRTEGFSQNLLGEIQHAGSVPGRRLMIILAAAVISALSLSYIFGLFEPKDTITIKDPVILSAAHAACSGPLSEDSLSGITELHLDSSPESFDELEMFPALSRLEIPADCAANAEALLDSAQYTIVIFGGN